LGVFIAKGSYAEDRKESLAMVSVVNSFITTKGIAISGVKSYKNYAIGRNVRDSGLKPLSL
jgi:hypothetical protein